jgi:acyl-CoA thioester hydrolase
MRKTAYFPAPRCSGGSPPPPALTHQVERIVRFEEVDALQVVWHGRYASYFEDARVAFGERYGLAYTDFMREGVVTPIKQLRMDFIAPLRFSQRCLITARLHWAEAARLNFSYAITDGEKRLLTTGCTVQLFLDAGGHLLLAWPDFYADFCRRWKNGDLA